MFVEIPILVGYSSKVIDLLFSIHYNSANLSSTYTHHGRIQIIPPGDPGIDCLAKYMHFTEGRTNLPRKGSLEGFSTSAQVFIRKPISTGSGSPAPFYATSLHDINLPVLQINNNKRF